MNRAVDPLVVREACPEPAEGSDFVAPLDEIESFNELLYFNCVFLYNKCLRQAAPVCEGELFIPYARTAS